MKKRNVFREGGRALVSRVAVSADVKKSVRKAVDLIGGFEKVVSSGDKMLVKPNFNSDDPFPASSDPEFVKAVFSLLYKKGASEVVIVESSGLPWLPTKNVMEKIGMSGVAEECGAEVKISMIGSGLTWRLMESTGREFRLRRTLLRRMLSLFGSLA